MLEVRQSRRFKSWLEGLADREASRRIVQRIVRLRNGLFGDVKPVRRDQTIVVLLCGVDKRTQDRDIRAAKAMAADLGEQGDDHPN